jgi:hypothetical protein
MCSQVSTGRSLASKATQIRKNTGWGGVRRRNSASSGVGRGAPGRGPGRRRRPALWAAGALAAYTGLRAGELVALRGPAPELLRGRCEVGERRPRWMGGWCGPTKTSARRTAPLPRFLCDQLAVSLAERPHGPDDLVFTAPQGGRLREQKFVAGPSSRRRPGRTPPDVASRKQRSRSQTCSCWWRWGDSNSGPPPDVLPARRPYRSLTCGSSEPIVTAGVRSSPLGADRACTQRVPMGVRPE